MTTLQPAPEPIGNGERPKQRAPKDFIEHVRTVHFTLVAVCTALLVITLSPPIPRYKAAYEEFKVVTSLTGSANGNMIGSISMESNSCTNIC
jgi:hypothetical protein